MMDPISSLSCAAAIVQFTQFAWTLIKTTREIHSSVDGATEAHVEAKAIALRLTMLHQAIEEGLALTDSDQSAAQSRSMLAHPHNIIDGSTRQGFARHLDFEIDLTGDKGLKSLAAQCSSLAQDLLKILDDIQRKSENSRFASWAAFRRAIEATRKQSRINSLEERINSLRSQINTELLQNIHIQIVALQNDLHGFMQTTVASRSEIMKELKSSRDDLRIIANDLQRLPLHSDICSTADGNQHGAHVNQQSSTSHKIDASLQIAENLRNIDNTIRSSQRILASLRFEEMPARGVQVPESYDRTFDWVFENHTSPLKSWLEGEDGSFWVSGKAGSGKSTLMKYLANDNRTLELLQRWAHAHKGCPDFDGYPRLAVGSHYFWRLGFPLQKSLIGLFRSLLYQILFECPDFMPVVCQDQLQSGKEQRLHRKDSIEWSLKDLSACMEKLCGITSWPCKFCFFIDGLDEYAGSAKEQSSMVEHLKRLAKGGDVKICVSSRPWNVFRSEYGGLGDSSIILQDHTKVDIDMYIEGQLEADTRLRRLTSTQTAMGEFAREIRDRANGVFLWVFLVVRSLLDGLTEDDDLHMLQQRLNALPPTLEEYFDLMLRCIDPSYKSYTARALLLACNATEPLSDQSYYYVGAEMSDPDYAVKMPVKPVGIEAIEVRRESVRSWINKWCRDLLEVNPRRRGTEPIDKSQQCCVGFLHRTIGDFLAAEDIQERFKKDAGIFFDPQISLCRSYLAQAKTLMSYRSDSREKFFGGFASLAGFVMFHAKAYEVTNNSTPLDILEDLDQVGDIYWDTPTSHWTAVCPRNANPAVTHELTFLGYAIEFDLQIYVQNTIELTHERLDELKLLEIACCPTLLHVALPEERESSQRMIALLAGLVVIERHATPTNLLAKVQRLQMGG